LLNQDNWLDVLKMDTSGFAEPLILPSINYLPSVNKENKIYPNPVDDMLTIERASENSSLKVYNANAILAATGTGRQLDVSKLTKGFYMLLVDNSCEGVFLKN